MPRRFQIDSTAYAEKQLSVLWPLVPAAEQTAYCFASIEIERLLAHDADLKGDPVNPHSPDLRSILFRPLRAYFEVSVSELKVLIIDYELALPKS